MADAKYTPGPWMVASGPSSVMGWPVVAQSGRLICRLGWLDKQPDEPQDDFDAFKREVAANGRLIAAAPSMYEALDSIFSMISYINIHGVGDQPEPRSDGQPQVVRVSPEEFGRIFQKIGNLASAALAKAEAKP